MSTFEERSLLEDMVARAVDDWVPAAEVYDIAQRSGLTDPDLLRALSIGLIGEALCRGLMSAGEYGHSDYQGWECLPSEALSRIAQDWFARPDPRVMPGEIVLLDNTTEGQARGEQVLRRERDQAP